MADTGTSLMQQPSAFPVGGGLASGLRHIPVQRMFLMLLATAILVSLIVGLVLYGKSADYRVLYGNVSDRDGGAIIQALQTMNVPYKFEGAGAIFVPSDQVHEVRLRLASQGLPRGGNVGFELMENQKFGMTQFQEQVNYQRALEGELARSIQSLSAVQSARVHLAIPKPSVFLREQQKPSASVLLTLFGGRTLDRDQVAGITHLISSSVPDLPVSAVSVLDQNGALLSNNNSAARPGSQLDAQQLAYVHQVEASYIKRIADILEPVVGRDNVRVQVMADLDFSESEATAETFKPNQNPAEASIRSQQISENTNGSGTNASGVPGALTNQPAPAATAPITGQAAPAAGTANTQNAVSSQKDSTTNYEVDKTVRHTRTPTGTIRRLSTAVVVNYKKPEAPAPAAKGAKAAAVPQPVALSAEELDKINALVKEAMGFTQARGDSLSLANVPFNQPKAEEVKEPPIWKDPENISLVKEIGKSLLIAGLIAVLLLTVVKPLIKAAKNLNTAQIDMPQLPDFAYDSPAQATLYEERLRVAREMAKNEPKVVASVVRDWVNKDE